MLDSTTPLTFDDVLIEPQYSEVKSRSDVSVVTNLGDTFTLDVPVISANMDSITEYDMASSMANIGGLGIIHRFMSVDEQVSIINRFMWSNSGYIGAAIGVKEDCFIRAQKCYEAGAKTLVLDVAHGHTKVVADSIARIKNKYPQAHIIAGNVATYSGAKFLCENGADAVKVGVGPGCHVAGTRVLMANGTYKNIEDIQVGDRVLNMHGEPTLVVNSWCTGHRKVRKVKHVGFYEPTYATGDHQYFVGNLNSTSKKSIAKKGYATLLLRESRTSPKVDKKQWRPIEDLDLDTFLAPKNLNFEIDNGFTLNLRDFTISKKARASYDLEVNESYGLGYIFGTFLGDGNARVLPNKSGSVHWSFGLHENDTAEKLVSLINEVFCQTLKPKISVKGTSVLQVSCFSTPLAKLLSTFGKKAQKHLPNEFFCGNREYQRGLYDGLIDSDGHLAKDGRTTFDNTSKNLLELISILSCSLYGSFGNFEQKSTTFGAALSTTNESIFNDAFRYRLNKSYKKRLLPDYQIIKKLEVGEESELEVPVYDIEVDCPTHSFIANNVIVHNSVCSTRIVAGVGVPQLTAIFECAKACSEYDIPLIADGGIRYPGDAAKAVAAGASAVMVGGLLSGTIESPGHIVEKDGRLFKAYRGMASRGAMIKRKEIEVKHFNGSSPEPRLEHTTPEGIETLVPFTNRSASDVVYELVGGLRSAMSYSNSSSIKEFHNNVKFIRITNAGLAESHPHALNR